jgi:hypothetical protein
MYLFRRKAKTQGNMFGETSFRKTKVLIILIVEWKEICFGHRKNLVTNKASFFVKHSILLFGFFQNLNSKVKQDQIKIFMVVYFLGKDLRL